MGEDELYLMDFYKERLAYFGLDHKGEIDVLFMGDSLIQRYDLPLFFPEWRVANRGIDGDRVDWLINRLDRSIEGLSPKAIVLLIGINDIVGAVINYPYLLAKLSKSLQKAKIFVLSLLPTGGVYGGLNEEAIEANKKIKTVAESFDATYLDVRGCLEDEDGELKEDYTVDGVHLSKKGYQSLTTAIKEGLREEM